MKRSVSAIIIVISGLHSSAAPRAGGDPASLVDPFIGTGGHGHTHPAATMPFGMVQLGPDTRLTGWDGCSGYHYSDSFIYGFSHTHLSGTGCSDYGDILFMPFRGGIGGGEADRPGDGASAGAPSARAGGCGSSFSHDREEASPGYYRVHLSDHDITAELTVTDRTGIHRYTYPGGESGMLIDLMHRDETLEAGLVVRSSTVIEGFRRSRAWAADQHVYFSARLSRPVDRILVNMDGRERVVDTSGGSRGESLPQSFEGKRIAARLGFRTEPGERVTVEVGLSAVSVEGARRNRLTEAGGRDFDDRRREAREAWSRALGRIRIEGGTDRQRTIFYTALYHALLAPNLYSDVDGYYRGRDLGVHRAQHDYYTVFSLWDTYRAEHPLLTIIEPERTVDFIRTFLLQYEQGGALPVWELGANETMCMIGYHAVPVIADAYIKGIRGFDADLALEAMEHSADLDHLGLGPYIRYGFIPSELEGESVSKTLEYAYDDWCVARMAEALGRKSVYERFVRRAQGYKNLFDPSTGFMRARIYGHWWTPFDPREVNFNYTEANAWQYTFSVPQDVSGLIELMGGPARFIEKLDRLFATSSETTGREQPDITGLIGQYAHGNEPSHHIAYLYCYAGEPWRTQARVREIMETMYGDGPDGLCGNEDCGQMSAWYVLSAIGFYPVTPGDETYVIGSPIFDRVEIDVGGGRVFAVEAFGLSESDRFIQAAHLDGRPFRRCFIRHGEILSGGTLRFEMGSEPNRGWGGGQGEYPVSAINDHSVTTVPFVSSGERIFRRETAVGFGCATPGAEIRFRIAEDGDWIVFERPITLRESALIAIGATAPGLDPSPVVQAGFTRIPADITISLANEYSPEYAAGGDLALVDGLRGREDFRTGLWQGYHGVDLEATVDLGSVRRIEAVTIGFLQESRSWIFLPVEVAYDLSSDGKRFERAAVLGHEVPQDFDGAVTRDFTASDIGREARFVRVRAKNIGVCPAWHPGAGREAWIFADEIVIETGR